MPAYVVYRMCNFVMYNIIIMCLCMATSLIFELCNTIMYRACVYLSKMHQASIFHIVTRGILLMILFICKLYNYHINPFVWSNMFIYTSIMYCTYIYLVSWHGE